MNILEEICLHKKDEIELQKKKVPLSKLEKNVKQMAAEVRPFSASIAEKTQINIIAEIKQRSPSGGILRKDFNAGVIAQTYEQAGAKAISILTDKKYFGGKLEYITDVKKKCTLPLLRKEFVIDEYQILEGKAAGADAILLIAGILDKTTLRRFMDLSDSLSMECLVEVHTKEELDIALEAEAATIGINNRNLDTLEVSLNTTLQLAEVIPDGHVIISESGINDRDQIKQLHEAGVDGFLIGESLMRSLDMEKQLRELTRMTSRL